MKEECVIVPKRIKDINFIAPSKKKILKHKKQHLILGNILRLLHLILMQKTLNLRRINQKMQRKVKRLRAKLQGGQESLEFLAQVSNFNQ